MDDLSHLSWPFFNSSCIEFARAFDRWVGAELVALSPTREAMARRRDRYFSVSQLPDGCETLSRCKYPVSNARLVFVALSDA